MEAKKSVAVMATLTQSLNTDSYDDVMGSTYINRDNFQNGLIKYGKDSKFYMLALERDVEEFKNKNANVEKSTISGFFTDKETVDKCKEKDGKINLDKLAEMLQVALHKNEEDERYYCKPYLLAFNINWNKLDRANDETVERLCNYDRKKDYRKSIEVAYGKVEANVRLGIGGGNQYYIPKESFLIGINKGIFEYNKENSYINKNSIIRNGVDEIEYRTTLKKLKKDVEKKLSHITVT